jgi:hypothetical protein
MVRWDVVEEEGLEEALTVDQAMVEPGAEPFPLVSNALTGSMTGAEEAPSVAGDEEESTPHAAHTAM